MKGVRGQGGLLSVGVGGQGDAARGWVFVLRVNCEWVRG